LNQSDAYAVTNINILCIISACCLRRY